MSEAETESNLHIKFVTNKEKTKVLFAEAGSGFTDILLSFLLLPLGTILKLLKKHYGDEAPNIGSLNTLYNGVANLDSIHFLNDDAKRLLLNPTGLDENEWPKFIGVKDGLNFTENAASFIISDDLRVMPNVEGSIMSTLSSIGIAMTDLDRAVTLDVAFGYNEVFEDIWVFYAGLENIPIDSVFAGGGIDFPEPAECPPARWEDEPRIRTRQYFDRSD